MDQQKEQKKKFRTSQEQKQYLNSGFNVFIIGFLSAGKSAFANAISDQEQLYFEKEGNQFSSINKNYFPIAQSDNDGTKEPNTIIKQDFQIWDLPGYGDREKEESNECHTAKDIFYNRLQQTIICNKSKSSHIVIIFSYSEFSVGKGRNIIKLSNLLAQEDLQASIIISKASTKVKLETIISKLEEQIKQPEINYYDQAKQFIQKVIQDKRLLIFYQPQLIDEKYQFSKDNLDKIKYLVFDKKNFHQIKLQYRFLPEDNEQIQILIERLKNQLRKLEKEILDITIQHNTSLIQPFNFSAQQQLKYEEQKKALQKEYKTNLGYYKLFQKADSLKLEQWEEKQFKDQLSKIDDFYFQNDARIVDSKLCVTSANFSFSQLRDIYNPNQNLKEIFTFASIQFIVDCNVEMPGVQIFIKTRQFRVINQSFINLKGQIGQSILDRARSGDEKNIHGDVGKNGFDGLAGGTLYVDAQEYYNLEDMTIDISGGDGGKGQDGGDGFDGVKGEDGNEIEVKQKKDSNQVEKCVELPTNFFEDIASLNRVFHYYYRSKGQAGTVGGNAGVGGKGGHYGPQGFISFKNLNGIQIQVINSSQQGSDGNSGTPGKGGQFGFDYVGQYQGVRFLGFLSKPKELKQQQNDEQLDTSDLSDGVLKQSSIVNKATENVVGQAAMGGIGVGAGIAVREIGFQTAAKLGIGAASAMGALAVLGIQFIATGADLLIRKGWNYIKKDEQNIKWASSGQIISQGQQQKNQQTYQEERDNKQQERLDYFIQFQQKMINQKRNQFHQLGLSEEQINRIIDQ
ncbi:hypothetical protein pb186bvf_001747 [Paramecium bursaria]